MVQKYAGLRGGDTPAPMLTHFNLSSVKLTEGSRFDGMQDFNSGFLLSLDKDRLACLYMSAANLSGTFSAPNCSSYGHPRYWGHYLGHWLSATSFAFASSNDQSTRQQLQSKSAAVVNMLSVAQDAWSSKGGDRYNGFLFPYDVVSFDRLFGYAAPGQYSNCDPVCGAYLHMSWFKREVFSIVAGMFTHIAACRTCPVLQCLSTSCTK